MFPLPVQGFYIRAVPALHTGVGRGKWLNILIWYEIMSLNCAASEHDCCVYMTTYGFPF